MSRVGKKHVTLPKGVECQVQADQIIVKGPKGSLKMAAPKGVDVAINNGQVQLTARSDEDHKMAGTARALINNMALGVSEGYARKLAAIAPIDERIQVLGPAEAPLAVIKGRYRFRLLVKSLRNVDLSEYLREWLAAGPKTKGNLKLEVDVDPQSFL